MSTADVIIGMAVNIAFTVYIILYSIHFDKRNAKGGNDIEMLKPCKRRSRSNKFSFKCYFSERH